MPSILLAKASYDDYQDRMKIVFENIDATYGLKGAAAPWHSSTTGEKLMKGGAEQIVTPLNAETLEIIGVILEYQGC